MVSIVKGVSNWFQYFFTNFIVIYRKIWIYKEGHKTIQQTFNFANFRYPETDNRSIVIKLSNLYAFYNRECWIAAQYRTEIIKGTVRAISIGRAISLEMHSLRVFPYAL